MNDHLKKLGSRIMKARDLYADEKTAGEAETIMEAVIRSIDKSIGGETDLDADAERVTMREASARFECARDFVLADRQHDARSILVGLLNADVIEVDPAGDDLDDLDLEGLIQVAADEDVDLTGVDGGDAAGIAAAIRDHRAGDHIRRSWSNWHLRSRRPGAAAASGDDQGGDQGDGDQDAGDQDGDGADASDGDQGDQGEDLEAMKLADLIAMAESEGVDLTSVDLRSKATVAAAVREHRGGGDG